MTRHKNFQQHRPTTSDRKPNPMTLHETFRKHHPNTVEELDAFLGFLASRLAAVDYQRAKALLHEAIDNQKEPAE